MCAFLRGHQFCILRTALADSSTLPAAHPPPNSSHRRHASLFLTLCSAGGMAVQPPSSNPSDGLFGAVSKQVDALCGAYTEKMRQLHSMLDMEEDSRERTARQTAAGRALWNHVIHDPLARFLAGESQLRKLQGKMEEAAKGSKAREMAGVMLAVRTLWFDGRIEAALSHWREGSSGTSATPQVVLLGAGMDARAYRMKCLEGCNVFEVDLPKIVDFKSALLKCAAMEEESHGGGGGGGDGTIDGTRPLMSTSEEDGGATSAHLYAARVERVAADLATEDWWDKLKEAGFKVGGPEACGGGGGGGGGAAPPTIWVLEGLLYYLKDAEALALLRRIAGSCLAGTLVLADFMNEFSTHLSTELHTQFYFHSDWPEELLPTLGFVRVRVSQMGDPDANFGLIGDSPLSFFHRLRHTPRYCKSDSDGNPCRRLFLVECSVA